MSDEQQRDPWQRLDEIFARALELSGKERDRFLAEVCAGDSELRRDVDALLRAADEAEGAGFLERPAEVTWEPLVSRLASAGRTQFWSRTSAGRVGERIGPYEIEVEIASGGMATVYRARRADGEFEQRVALKVIRPGLAGERLIRRFVTERQILAELDHPGIARLLDGGTTDDGLPYLVMEFVEGEPITDYCDGRGLRVDERLRLFLEAADAVRHAHRNLVLHRDLKPSNILVTEDGRVKLLDFGIAKLLDPASGGGEPTLTQPELRPLTPDCASPEQIRGEALTTASDVYQLGVLLYRLLTGQPPYRLRGSTAGALEKAIEETDPDAPSEVLLASEGAKTVDITSGHGEEDGAQEGEVARERGGRQTPLPAEEIARNRGTTPEWLCRKLRGDLDTIVLKALRKEPERRYASVEGLAGDIRRHLAGHPVSARPDRWSYRARKFLGRHRWLAPVAAALVLVVGGYVWTVNRHAALLERERNVARAEAARASQIRDFLVTVFEGSDPEETLGDTLTARTLLERGVRRADSVLADQPELRAEMLGVMGRVMTSLGFYDRVMPLLERVVELRREIHGAEDPRVATALMDLGHAHQASRGFAEAEGHFREALELNRAAVAPGDSALVENLQSLAMTLRDLGQLDSAEHYLQEALEIARVNPGPESDTYVFLLADQAYVLRAQGKLEEAEKLYREALDRLRDRLGPTHPDLAPILNNLAYLHKVRGELTEAVGLYREALVVHRDVFGPGHPHSLMVAQNLAMALEEQGEMEEVLEVRRANVAAAEKQWPEGHWRVGVQHGQLGIAYLRSGAPVEAERSFWQGEQIMAEELGEEHSWTVAARAWVAVARLAQGVADASHQLRQIRSGLSERPAVDREDVAWNIRKIAEWLESHGRPAAATRWRSLLPE